MGDSDIGSSHHLMHRSKVHYFGRGEYKFIFNARPPRPGRQAVSLPLPACPGRQDASHTSNRGSCTPGRPGAKGEGSTGGGDGCCWSPAEPGSSGPIWSPALTRPGGPTSWLTTRSATPANGAISVNASSPTWCRPAN